MPARRPLRRAPTSRVARSPSSMVIALMRTPICPGSYETCKAANWRNPSNRTTLPSSNSALSPTPRLASPIRFRAPTSICRWSSENTDCGAPLSKPR